jgi:hypothetical protein
MTAQTCPQLTPGESASYRIVVAGCLDDEWSGRLSDMHIETRSGEDKSPVTTLAGQIRDQAALRGVLNSLYQLHMRILSVSCTRCQEPEETS